MVSIIKLENISALIAATSVASLGVGILFMLGYTWPVSTKIVSMLSYRDLLLLVAQSFLWLIVPVLFGMTIGEAQIGFRKSRNILDAKAGKQAIVPSSERAKRDKFVAIAMSKRFPTISISIGYFIAAASAFVLVPKIYLIYVAIAGLGAGMYVVLLFFAKEWYFTKGYIFIAVFVVGLIAFIFGNWNFYRDAFYMTTQITLQKPIDGINGFILLRPVDEVYLLFRRDSGRVYIVNKDLDNWVRFESLVCDESEKSYFGRLFDGRVTTCK